MSAYILRISKDNVVISRSGGPDRIITSEEDYAQYLAGECKKYKVELDDLIVMTSSTMDFPYDFTKNEATIALARKLR